MLCADPDRTMPFRHLFIERPMGSEQARMVRSQSSKLIRMPSTVCPIRSTLGAAKTESLASSSRTTLAIAAQSFTRGPGFDRGSREPVDYIPAAADIHP